MNQLTGNITKKIIAFTIILSFIFPINAYCGVTKNEVPVDVGYGEGNAGLKYAIEKSITDEVRGIIENDTSSVAYSQHMFNYPIRIKYMYDEVESCGYLYEQPWPYCLQETEENAYTPDEGWSYPNETDPSVGDVLKSRGLILPEYEDEYDGLSGEQEERLFDDTNMCEPIAVISYNESYNYKTTGMYDSLTRITEDESLKYYYELEIKYYAVWIGTRTNPDGSVDYDVKTYYAGRTDEEVKEFVDSKGWTFYENGFTYNYDHYYATCRLKPFGLREMFYLADALPDDKYQNTANKRLKFTNLDLLDRNEYYMRMHSRFDEKFQLSQILPELPDDTYDKEILGISYIDPRSKKSIIYEDILKALEEGEYDIEEEKEEQQQIGDEVESEGYEQESGTTGRGDMHLNGISGEIMNIPGIGETVDCIEINTGLGYNAIRSNTDSYSMEFTLGYLQSHSGKYKTLNGRLNTLLAGSESSNAGSDGQLFTVNVDGQTYYVGALVDGFSTPGGAYEVTLNTGQTFNMIAMDVKSLADAPGTGGNLQVDTNYGHGYLSADKTHVQMNICEFLDASTSHSSISNGSAINYSNAPMANGTYVTTVKHIGNVF